MSKFTRTTASFGALACAMMITTSAVNAQDPTVEIQQCTAAIQPAEIEAGQQAVAVTAMLTTPIGGILEVTTSEENGLQVASPEDLPRTEMAADSQPTAINMDESGSQVTVWLNTEAAVPGQHEVAFQSAEGSCVGTLTVR